MRTQVALKLETTEGTDITPGDSDVINPVYDVDYQPEHEQNDRKTVRASLSKDPAVAGARMARIKFSTELKGSGSAGTAPTNLSAPFKACRMTETIVGATSVTYKPASSESSVASATVVVKEGNAGTSFKLKKIIGARGTFKLVAGVGNIVYVQFEFLGRYVAPSDSTAFTDLTTTPDPIAFLGATLSFQGVATLKVTSVTIDLGNVLVARKDVNQATGVFAAAIVDRNCVGEMDPEQELTSTIDFPVNLTTDVESSLSYALTGSAGNITTVTCPKTQIRNLSEAERDQIRTQPLTLRFNRNSAGGDDEISIAFT